MFCTNRYRINAGSPFTDCIGSCLFSPVIDERSYIFSSLRIKRISCPNQFLTWESTLIWCMYANQIKTNCKRIWFCLLWAYWLWIAVYLCIECKIGTKKWKKRGKSCMQLSIKEIPERYSIMVHAVGGVCGPASPSRSEGILQFPVSSLNGSNSLGKQSEQDSNNISAHLFILSTNYSKQGSLVWLETKADLQMYTVPHWEDAAYSP